MEARLKLTVTYDGSRFQGSQRQAGRETVQGRLEAALSELAGRPVPAMLAGRTDRGVHAAGQVASCELIRPEMPLEQLRRALDPWLGDGLAVTRIERAPADFHARHDVVWREYRYRIWSGARSPLMAATAWHRRGVLDTPVMSDAASRLVGKHDFASFVGGGEGVPWSARQSATKGTIRFVHSCTVNEVGAWWPADPSASSGQAPAAGRGIEIRVVADGFLPRMVRGFVGALSVVGRRANEPEWIDELLERADRRSGPPTAPPHGLVLWRIGYGDDQP